MMNSLNSIEVNDLQFEIDRKFFEIQKQKKQGLKANNAKVSVHNKTLQQITWNSIKKQIFMLQKPPKRFKIARPRIKNDDLMDVINRILLLQKSVIELGTDVSKYRRLQMLCIFFQCSLSIIFNAYNMVVFLLRMANQTDDVPLSLAMLLFFYGYHILSSMTDILISVLAYSGVFETIRKTASKMDELNMYILDGAINARISQLSAYVFNNLRTFTLFGLYSIDGSLVTSIMSGTATYIIILIQYSGDGEICKTSAHLKMNETEIIK